MGALFDANAHLFDGLIYDRNVYGKRPGCDPDIIREGLAPIADIERRGMAKLGDIELDLLTHKLTSIVEEARDVYTALSISEGAMLGDMNCGLFTASGDPVVVGTGIYFHTLLQQRPAQIHPPLLPGRPLGRACRRRHVLLQRGARRRRPQFRHVRRHADLLGGRADRLGRGRRPPGRNRLDHPGRLRPDRDLALRGRLPHAGGQDRAQFPAPPGHPRLHGRHGAQRLHLHRRPEIAPRHAVPDAQPGAARGREAGRRRGGRRHAQAADQGRGGRPRPAPRDQ